MIKTLDLDIESLSDADLVKSGVYKYAESPKFEILLVGVSVNGGDVRVYDLAQGEMLPEEIVAAIASDDVIKWAHNASFERVCFSHWLKKNYPQYFNGDFLNPKSWRCSLVWAAYLGLPLSLREVGDALGLDKQKLSEGANLIKYFCVPLEAKADNKQCALFESRTRNLPSDNKEKWEQFIQYNRRDVEVEMEIQRKLKNFPVPDFVWDEYALDQQINDRGIAVDMDFVDAVIAVADKVNEELVTKLKERTGLENPNSVAQLKEWLVKQGISLDALDKKAVKELLKTAPSDVAEVLKLRQQIAKSSLKKYTAMRNAVCRDNRARGMFQFYGANRSGRWAGKIIQFQNLPQNHLDDLAGARSLVKTKNPALPILYDDVPDTLSQLVRTAFVPKDGCKFIVADFSAIEARVLSFLADENWRLEVFKNGGDIYCASASKMFKVPVEKHGQNAHLRQKGKQAELACGYGGAVGALKAMGALDYGLKEDELQPLVDAWRSANPNIVKFWWDVERAVKKAIKAKMKVLLGSYLTFSYRGQILFITLPSGRNLSYVKPQIEDNQYGGKGITYMGISATKHWERISSYGPKFVENIVQAVSRDILMYAMQSLKDCRIVAHVHDEVIIETAMETSVEDICAVMSRTPPWADGLPLNADGYECEFYKKD